MVIAVLEMLFLAVLLLSLKLNYWILITKTRRVLLVEVKLTTTSSSKYTILHIIK